MTVPPTAETPPEKGDAGGDAGTEIDTVLDLFFSGRVEEVMPQEEAQEFRSFLREEALRRRRFAVSFRVDCGCLAWIGYALSNVVTRGDEIDYTAVPTQSYIPDHEADVEHPEGPTEEPPAEFVDWPIWPFEIYQDEADGLDEGERFNGAVDELVGDLGV